MFRFESFGALLSDFIIGAVLVLLIFVTYSYSNKKPCSETRLHQPLAVCLAPTELVRDVTAAVTASASAKAEGQDSGTSGDSASATWIALETAIIVVFLFAGLLVDAFGHVLLDNCFLLPHCEGSNPAHPDWYYKHVAKRSIQPILEVLRFKKTIGHGEPQAVDESVDVLRSLFERGSMDSFFWEEPATEKLETHDQEQRKHRVECVVARSIFRNVASKQWGHASHSNISVGAVAWFHLC